MKTIYIGSLILVFMVGIVVGLKGKPHNKDWRDEDWTAWGGYTDTRDRGWYYDEGLIQFRTNLITGEIEKRHIQ